MIDLIIAILAVLMIIFVSVKQFKSYKKKGTITFCDENCNSCEKCCGLKKHG